VLPVNTGVDVPEKVMGVVSVNAVWPGRVRRSTQSSWAADTPRVLKFKVTRTMLPVAAIELAGTRTITQLLVPWLNPELFSTSSMKRTLLPAGDPLELGSISICPPP